MRIVILGAGQAAASMAARLRAGGHDGPLTVVGAEPVAPYQRPPLSKSYLLGQMGLDRLLLRADDWWPDQRIELRLGETATAIDTAARLVATDRGSLEYDALALTLGAHPRRLPAAMGGDLPGVHVVRTLADVDALAAQMLPGRRLIVIGGGYIGLEAAAVARKLGLTVTLIESAPRILGRVAAPQTADMIRALHLAHGVEIMEAVCIERIMGDSHATGVALADGRELQADLIVTGIGVAPETALAHAAGLAIDMAETVADNMLGADRVHDAKPWFWSDQFDAKLQIAGLGAGYDRIVTRPGDGQHGGSVWYFRNGRLIAVDALNDARAYMIGKRLIESGRSPDPAAIPTVPDLKALM